VGGFLLFIFLNEVLLLRRDLTAQLAILNIPLQEFHHPIPQTHQDKPNKNYNNISKGILQQPRICHIPKLATALHIGLLNPHQPIQCRYLGTFQKRPQVFGVVNIVERQDPQQLGEIRHVGVLKQPHEGAKKGQDAER
jgi:hypothetical protein